MRRGPTGGSTATHAFPRSIHTDSSPASAAPRPSISGWSPTYATWSGGRGKGLAGGQEGTGLGLGDAQLGGAQDDLEAVVDAEDAQLAVLDLEAGVGQHRVAVAVGQGVEDGQDVREEGPGGFVVRDVPPEPVVGLGVRQLLAGPGRPGRGRGAV
ncbi:hypothetical protein SMICM17S_07963 [Streptomyces microflavus]